MKYIALLVLVFLSISCSKSTEEAKPVEPEQELTISVGYIDMDGNTQWTPVVWVSH